MGKTAGSSKASSKKKGREVSLRSAVISYQLSDPVFISLKWTKLPPIVQQSLYSCKTKPWACFKKRDVERKLYYPKGQTAAKFDTDGTGKICYIDGTSAIELTQSILGYQRINLYSNQDMHGERKSLGWLDSFGNCIMSDFDGNIIANYNQIGGYIFTKDGHWKWRWDQLVGKHRMMPAVQPDITTLKRVKSSRDAVTEKTSEKLLDLHIKNAPTQRVLKLLDGKIYFQCKISDCMTLWISSQEKIDLSFVSNSFITRLDVGVTMQMYEELSDTHLRHPSVGNMELLKKSAVKETPPGKKSISSSKDGSQRESAIQKPTKKQETQR